MPLVQPAPLRFPTPDGVALHAWVWSAGPDAPAGAATVVLLHGGGANAHWWDHLAPELARAGHIARVVALDFRGHGESDHPRDVVPGAFGRDLDALLGALDEPDVVLVGHSMGGHVALAHAARRGAAGRAGRPALRGLVAVDVSRGASRGSRRRARLALALRRTYPSFDDAVARFRFVPEAAASEALRASIARHSVRREADGRYGYAFDPRWFSLPPDAPPDWASIRCPVLLVRGAQSPLLSAEGAAALCAEIPDARVVEIEAAGHHVLLDRPEALLGALRGFLARCIAGYAGCRGKAEAM
jgi:pimeloyl-ACP methyl ester carboxylesterase